MLNDLREGCQRLRSYDDLKRVGFDLLNRANNHTTDYGIEGILETSRLLDSLGLVRAGTRMTLSEATQAKYLETGKGRFALIGFASSFSPSTRAGEPRAEIEGRPGLNPLRVDRRRCRARIMARRNPQ